MALKAALVVPAATVTRAGTVSRGWLLASDTVAPVLGATALSVTVQTELPGLVTMVEVQLRLLSAGAAETLAVMPPDTAVTGSSAPLSDAPIASVTAMGVLDAPAASVALTVANAPARIADAFTPVATHVYRPATPAHFSDLFEAVSAAPAVAEIFVMFCAGYDRVHSTAAVSAAGAFSDNERETTPPAVPDAEDSANWLDCPQAGPLAMHASQTPNTPQRISKD